MRELDNAYRILELEPGASLEAVNQAYKDLVFVWHPDRIPQDNTRLYEKAQDKIKALNHARDLLRSHSRSGHSASTSSRHGTASSYRASTA
ncbi:MAG: J domain-containing protein, partial [Nodosilinea sp.]